MKLSDKYTIYVDFGIKDNLCEYFNCRDIIFNFITKEDDDVPIVDRAFHDALYKSDKKIILIVDIPTIEKLYQQVSKYNNFSTLVDSGRIKLIYYRPSDSLLQDIEVLKNGRVTWLEDCLVGEDIKREFKNTEFHYLHHPIINWCRTNHLSNLRINKVKKNTFFSLIRLRQTRRHRNLLIQEMQGKEYLKDAITKIHGEGSDNVLFLKDLETEYGKTFLDQATWKHGLPIISYYENTCFELVCETLGEVSGDDSFHLSEKTIKPIAMGHPFIMLSTKHFLKNLKELGFLTFGDYIDESYDECGDPNDRVEIISKNLERLDITESKKFYNDTRFICEHNQNHLMNLQGRYKFDLWKNLDELFKKY